MRLGGGGDHLNSAIPQGDQKNFTHTVGGITKNSQNLKNFQRPPLPIKNDTSLTLAMGQRACRASIQTAVFLSPSYISVIIG